VSALDTRDELVPLHTDFDVVWRGCDRGQVAAYVERVEEELRLLAVDRDAATRRADALAAQLEAARAEIQELTEKLDRLSRTPADPVALTDRLRRMVDLAHAEADEIVTRARATAEQTRTSAEQAADRLRRRGEYLVEEADRRRRELDEEHRQLVARAERQARQAEHRRRELDEQAAELRAQIQTDFELAMKARREETMRELAAQRTTATREAANLIREAEKTADRVVTAAREEVARLRVTRDRIAEKLRIAGETLAQAGPLLAPLPEEPPEPLTTQQQAA
jgi:cell division septum initiation protein DivIVA